MENFTVRYTDRSLMVVIGSVATLVDRNDERYEKVLAAAKKNDLGGIKLALIPPVKEKVLAKIDGFKVTKEGVFWGDQLLHGVVVNRIMEFVKAEQPIEPMVRFLSRLYQNPSHTSREQLYMWLQHKQIPITDEGTILCYKAVRSDFYSVHSGQQIPLQGKTDKDGRIFNGVGETIELRRHDVDDNTRNHCSNGLHVGSLAYVRDFCPHGGVMLIVELDPADVVSVPEDCDCQKVRCTRYKVVGIYQGPLPGILDREQTATYEMPDDEINVQELEAKWESDSQGDVKYDRAYEDGFEEGFEEAMRRVKEQISDI